MKVVTFVFLMLLLTGSLAAQKSQPGSDWEATPIADWSANQVKFILTQSPWAKIVNGDTAITNPVLGPGAITAPSSTLVALRSSMLIRYALLRQRQLTEKYDSMTEAAKLAFNERNRSLIECPACEKYYVVSITGASETLRDKQQVMARAKFIYLSNEKGEKRPLMNFVPQADAASEALFFFSRNDESGSPLVTAANEKLTFNFRVESSEDTRLRSFEHVDFKVKDLVRGGKVIF